MSLFKKLFTSNKSEKKISEPKTIQKDNLHLDDSFVKNFTAKNGKFIYCSHQEEVNENLQNIIQENTWENVFCLDNDLQKLLLVTTANCIEKQKNNVPFFTNCESLIANEGNIMFNSKQLGEIKLKDLPANFIVLAKTSQILNDKGDALISINSKYNKEKPTNIGAIKCYDPNKKDDSLLGFGNNNSKNLYLLLLEDL